MMKRSNLFIIYTCTILTLCTLYALQPIQPLFENEFSLSRFQAVIFTTIIMLPLGIAPIAYGYILETIPSKKILRISVLILGVLELLFAMSDTYIVLLAIRGLQGLIIPALLTSLMSYISFSSSKEHLQQAIGFYIAATILGGFLGRVLSGTFSDLFGWRVFFALLGVALISMYFFLGSLEEKVKVNATKPKVKQIFAVLKKPSFLYLYLLMFSVFFIFQGVLNFLPFHLQGILDDISSQTKIGFVYAGYVVGLIISIKVLSIIRFFGKETRGMLAGAFIYLLGIQVFHSTAYEVVFAGMFVFCAGMFIIHAIASGYVNKLALENRAISNGLYISFYYAGGVVGSFAPGVVFEYFGWSSFLYALSLLCLCSIVLILLLNKSVEKLS